MIYDDDVNVTSSIQCYVIIFHSFTQRYGVSYNSFCFEIFHMAIFVAIAFAIITLIAIVVVTYIGVLPKTFQIQVFSLRFLENTV